MSDVLGTLDATALAERVRRRETSPLELVDAAIARIERVNPKLNAVITERFEKARAEATSPDLPKGPFHGVPLLLKDLGGFSAGDPFHAGMKFLRDLGWTEPEDSYLIRKYREAGFVLLGKTNTPELGLVPTTEPEAYGRTRNPWNPEHSSGGSSGGSAAAVASGMVPVGHGGDGGGSIRIPASACGLVGLKGTRGRFSMGPHIGDTLGGISIEGVITRTVRDTAAILDVSHGYMPGDPYSAPLPSRPYAAEVGADPGTLRIGFMARIPGGDPELHPDARDAVLDAAKLLESLGHRIEESNPAAMDEDAAGMTIHFMAIWSARTAAALDAWSARTGKPIGAGDVEPLTWALAQMARQAPAPAVATAITAGQASGRRLARWWEDGFDLLLTPTLSQPPARLGRFDPKPDDPLWGMRQSRGYLGHTAQFNMSGQPGISVPLYWNGDDLPIGVQLVGAYGREDLLLRVASQLEQARPWADRRPPVHALNAS
jgi:amidase